MIAAGEYRARVAMWSDIQQHLPRLHAEASIPDAQIIDLGVRAGNSTAAFLAAVEKHGGHVYSVDVNTPPSPFHGHPQWTFIAGDDLIVADQLPDQVDIVFIDTSHDYVQTCAELEVYVPKVRAGGVVLLHDTELEHPDASPVSDPSFPVRVAVDEYCTDNGLTAEFVTGCNGLGVIRIGGDDGN